MKRGMRTRMGAAGLVCALLLGATEARAQDQTSPTQEAAPAQGTTQGTTQATTSDAAPAEGGAQQKAYMASQHAGADLYWYSAKVFGSTFALVPTGSVEVKENLYLDFWVPLALNVGSAADKSYFGLGNPTVGVHYAMKSGPTTFYIGGRAGFPLVHLLDDRDMSVATSIATYAMTLYDNHLWVPYLPIGAFGGVEHVAAEIIHLRAELAPTFLIPLGSRDLEFQYQLRGEVEARHESGFGAGLGLQAVHVVTSNGNNAQAAFEPFVGYDNQAIFARLGLLTAIDKPLGFGFDSDPLKVATARFRLGAYF